MLEDEPMGPSIPTIRQGNIRTCSHPSKLSIKESTVCKLEFTGVLLLRVG